MPKRDPIKTMDRLQAEMARRMRVMAGILVTLAELIDKLPPGALLRIDPEFRDAVEVMRRFLAALPPELRPSEPSRPRPTSPSIAWMRSVRAAFAGELMRERTRRTAT